MNVKAEKNKIVNKMISTQNRKIITLKNTLLSLASRGLTFGAFIGAF
jgi:hypothetical protein